MSGSVREGLQSIIRDHFKIHDPIEDKTLIYHDLWIAGDDAGELLEEIHAKFGTSFKGLDFHSYFPDDLDATCYWIGSWFGLKDKRKSLSFGHLARVIEAGSWFEE
jgi:hypothetical protein